MTLFHFPSFAVQFHFFKLKPRSNTFPPTSEGSRGSQTEGSGRGTCSNLILNDGIFNRKHQEKCLNYGYSVRPCAHSVPVYKAERQSLRAL